MNAVSVWGLRFSPRVHRKRHGSAVLILLVGAVAASIAEASQPLETETARFLPPKSFEAESTIEYQTSSEGTETSLPFAVEYGITKGIEFLLEPVAYTAIRPKTGTNATDVGDTEVTMTFLLRQETGFWPAFAAAAEVKFATASNTLVGTGKTDYAGYLIASKKLGLFDVHANVAYTVLGKPAGVQLKDIWNFALAGELRVTPRFDLVAEYLQNSSSAVASESSSAAAAARHRSITAGQDTIENPLTPELAGGEKVAMAGMRYYISSKVCFAFGVTHDNSHAILYRPGITIKF